MSVTAHELGLESLDSLQSLDALCLFVSEEDRPLPATSGFVDWRLCGALSRVLKAGFFTGASGDCLLLPSEGRLPMPRIFVMGLGSRRALDTEGFGAALASAAEVLQRAKIESLALEVPLVPGLSEEQRAAALTRSLLPSFAGKRVALLAEKALLRLLPAPGK